MPRKFTILALFVSVALWLANSGNPPNARTEAPSEGSCSDCHSCGSCQQTGSVTMAGLPALIEPNQAYVLTLTNAGMGTGANEAGFQVTILNGSNQKAGNMTGAGTFSHLETFNNRQYWEHFPAQPYSSGQVSWTVTWTAPNGPMNTTITAYCIGNIANASGTTSGDKIVTSQATGQLNGGGLDLSVTITNVVNVLCNGGATGSATASPMNGAPPYTYHWSNNATTQTINNLSAGTYSVTVTDNASSTATASVTITQPTALVLNTPQITHVSCNGGNNGAITASASGGTGPYSFHWTTGANTATITNLTAGTYGVTVTDDNACTKTASYTVTQPTAITITLQNLTDESCLGEADGAITIATSGGVNPLISEWSNGATGNAITNLAPGNYIVTVTDNNDCTKTASYTVDPGGTVTVSLVNQVNVTCPGGNNGSLQVNATGGTGPYTYSWSNGASGATISNLFAGSYTVTGTDSHGCTDINTYTITQPPAFSLSIAQAQSNLCFGDANVDLTATVFGGTAPYTALWSNGVTGLSNPNLPAGTYTITITDDAQCTATATSVVTQAAQLTTSVVTTDETGSGANNGTATANAIGGTGAYTYLWNTGGTTQTITGLPPGTYSVTVTDANGCTSTASGQVDAFGCNVNVDLGIDLTVCEGETSMLTAGVTGGVAPVTFLWSTGATTPSITVTGGGEFCVTVIDNANCQDVDCVIITESVIPDFTCPVVDESAPGMNDGAIQCDTIAGVIAYLWSNGATTPVITNLAPGIYCLTVTDINGCTNSQCFNVQAGNCNLSITSTITDILCNGDTTGSITVNLVGGTAPITYAWSNGETTSTIDNLGAGNYSVTITDGAACIETGDFTVNENPALVLTIDSIQVISDVGPGSINISVTGGQPPYTYLWTDPGGAQNGNEDQTGLGTEGFYSVVVTDAVGCTVSNDSIFVDADVAVGPVPKFIPLKVYPVPTQNMLFIDLEGSIKEIILTGIDGRTIRHETNLVSNRLDVSTVEPGWYLLRISDGQNWYIARMVK